MAMTLYGGLIIQIIALSILTQMNPDSSIAALLVFIMVLQGMSGAARNLTTTTSKSSLKKITDNQEGALFKWVARFTSSKNFIRGAGFLSGAVLLGLFGFSTPIILIAGFLAVVTVEVVIVGVSNLPLSEKGIRLREVFSKNKNVNSLAMARMFLYGACDMRACHLVGLFTGLRIVVYGMIQTFSPNFVKYGNLPILTLVQYLKNWGRGIPAIPFILGGLTFLEHMNFNWIPATLILGLFIIGYIFAISSSIHSFLILAFSQSSRVTLDVGYYYMANSGGRVIGTFLSGLSFQLGGISLCLFTASAIALLAWFASLRIKPVQHLNLGYRV